MSSFNHVRGDTFSVLHTLQQASQQGRDLTGFQITATLEQRNGVDLVALAVQVLDQATHQGQFILSCLDTSTWPLAKLQYKVQFVDAMGVIRTSGFIDVRVTSAHESGCCGSDASVSMGVEITFAEQTVDQLLASVGTVVSHQSTQHFIRISAVPLRAYTLVTTNEQGQVICADPINADHLNKIIGLSLNSASVGGAVRIQAAGEVFHPEGWMLPIGAVLFLGIDGALSTDPLIGACAQTIGYVLDSNTIFLNIQHAQLWATSEW